MQTSKIIKQRVESCLTIGPPRGLLRDTESVWYWHRYGWLVRYRLIASTSILNLDFDHGLPAQQNIKLDRTQPNYGGDRWWFLCPQCNRRVTRLHLPSDAYRFFCRDCHNLSYESAQSSHKKSERFFHRIAQDLETTTREARLWFRLQKGGIVHEVKRPLMGKVRDRRTGIALIVTKQARQRGLSL